MSSDERVLDLLERGHAPWQYLLVAVIFLVYALIRWPAVGEMIFTGGLIAVVTGLHWWRDQHLIKVYRERVGRGDGMPEMPESKR